VTDVIQKPHIIDLFPCEGLRNGTHIELMVYYYRGGRDIYSSDDPLPGYYLKATPVRKEGGMSTSAFYASKRIFLSQDRSYSAENFEKAVRLSESKVPVVLARLIAAERAA